MNWIRGLFRVWILVSAIWVLVVGYQGYSHWNNRAFEVAGTTAVVGTGRKASKFGGVPVFDPSQPYEVITPFDWWDYLLAALGLPALLYGAGISVRWITTGFRR